MRKVRAYESTPRKSFPHGRIPAHVDEASRLYTLVPRIDVAGCEWGEVLVIYDADKDATTAYLTNCGWDATLKGPALECVRGKGKARYREVMGLIDWAEVRQWPKTRG